jgi:hypothetical protein
MPIYNFLQREAIFQVSTDLKVENARDIQYIRSMMISWMRRREWQNRIPIGWVILCLAFLPASLRGQSTTVYSFLRNDVSARAAGLAGSVISMTDDPSMLFYNPASLPTLNGPEASAGFFKHLLDINSGYVVYGQEIRDVGHFGVGILYTNYGSFDRIDDLGNIQGTFTASDLSFELGYGTALDENFYAGGGLEFISSSIAGYSSSGLAANAGILYVIPDKMIALGLSVRHIGAQLSTYAGVRESLPVDLTIGGSIVPRGLPLLLNVNFHKLNEDVGSFADRFRSFTVGGEFTLSKAFQVRVGYDNSRRKDLKTGTTAGLAGFSGGIGLVVSRYKIDYALSSLGGIGNLHRISIGTNF